MIMKIYIGVYYTYTVIVCVHERKQNSFMILISNCCSSYTRNKEIQLVVNYSNNIMKTVSVTVLCVLPLPAVRYIFRPVTGASLLLFFYCFSGLVMFVTIISEIF